MVKEIFLDFLDIMWYIYQWTQSLFLALRWPHVKLRMRVNIVHISHKGITCKKKQNWNHIYYKEACKRRKWMYGLHQRSRSVQAMCWDGPHWSSTNCSKSYGNQGASLTALNHISQASQISWTMEMECKLCPSQSGPPYCQDSMASETQAIL